MDTLEVASIQGFAECGFYFQRTAGRPLSARLHCHTFYEFLYVAAGSCTHEANGAQQALTCGNLRRQLSDSLENKPFPPLPASVQRTVCFAFGSAEEHCKNRDAVMQAYPDARFPVFEGYNHMQYQIRDPRGFAEMLRRLDETDRLPELPFLRK